jgi:FkbM family methyltransferase
VRGRAGFVARELIGRPTTHVYKLRSVPYRAAIRHPLFDMWVLDEIFRNRAYAMPASVEKRLRAHDGPLRVLDLGGHVGLFGLWFRSQFRDAQFKSYEPDPENVAVLRNTVRVNQLEDSWTVVEAAASTHEGEATDEHATLEAIFPFLRGQRLLTPTEVTVHTLDVLPEMAQCDFLKLDIHGGEWPLLTDRRFKDLSASAFVMELHPQAAPVPEPLAWTSKLLTRLGFTLTVMPAYGKERIIWGWRQ